MGEKMNGFTNFLANQPIFNGPLMQLQEKWILNEDDVADYYAITNVPGADDSENVWMVYKNLWGGTDDKFQTDKILPDDGVGFKYNINDIATYFS